MKMQSDNFQSHKKNQSLERRVHALEMLINVGNTLASSIRLYEDEILELILEQAQKLTGSNNLYIALYDEETGMIHFPLATENGKPVSIPSRQVDMKMRGKAEEIILTRQPILHRTKREGQEWYSQIDHSKFLGRISLSWLGVPMLLGERVLGIIATADLDHENAYDELELDVLVTMATQAAIAIQNARLYELARAEVVAAKQLSTLGTAIAALQHRINNTFNIIVPNVARLRSRVDLSDPTIAEILDIIERNARYTSTIISRIQEPLKEVQVTDVNINAIISEVSNRLIEIWKLGSRDISTTITLELDDQIPIIRVPSGHIAEIIDNLLLNARNAMPNGGEIKITSELANSNILVRVIDSGDGISHEIQQRLFQKPVPSRSPGGGAGLGLWLSRLMLQSIGGNIEIESSNQSGTTMLVSIPSSHTTRA